MNQEDPQLDQSVFGKAYRDYMLPSGWWYADQGGLTGLDYDAYIVSSAVNQGRMVLCGNASPIQTSKS